MQATFAGNPELTLISVYAPTNCKGNEESAEEFYSQLRDAIGQTPQHNLLLVLGDFYAKISSAHTRYAHDKRTNENGVRLVDLSCEKSLIITNNNLLKKDGNYSSFASVGSDHRVVTIKLRLSLRMPKSPPPKKRYDWRLLKVDKDLCSRFTLELRNKYNELYDESSDATEQYAALVKAKDHAAETVLPPTPKGKRDRHSNNPTVLALRKKNNQLAHRYSVN